jgi:serine/threonine-protein kinase
MTDSLRDQLQAVLGPGIVIERELGAGGMSRVFLAEERALDRRLVVKVLAPELAAGVNVERFRREIQLAAGLQHPHIVPVIGAGEVPDGDGRGSLPYFTMPYVAGDSLRSRVDREGALPLRDVVGILRDVARGLAYAHASGVVHRDIKPDNILLSAGTAAITDFGVARALSSARRDGGDDRLTFVGMSLGTPAYMAPEQAAGDPDTDHRADLYALGVVAYEMLAGATPFAGRSTQALLVAQLTEQPAAVASRRKDTPVPLAELVMRALRKNPAERVQSADEFLAQLDAVRSGAVRPGPRIIAAALVVLTLVVLGAWWLGRSGTRRASDPQAIAVLPLVNTGGDPEDEYFSDGMTDELAGALTRVPGLRVASRTSSYAFKGVADVDVREIGERLGVGAVLEGTVRRQGSRLRLAAQLTNTEDGLTIWSETYEREVDDVFRVQDELARAIVAALAPRLASGSSAARVIRAATPPTDDLEAYDLYLRGRYFWHQRGEPALRQAAELFEQAVARDPEYAEAHAGLADALALLPVYGTTPADSVLPRARSEAERAVALDSTLANAHATLGLVLKTTGDWAGAERALRRAVALDSTAAETYQWYGEIMVITGRLPEAAAALRRARRLDPLSPIIAAELGYMLTLAGEPDSGVAAGRDAIALAPDLWTGHAFLGSSWLFQGRAREAIPELERAVQLDPAVTLFKGVLANAYASAGRSDDARRIVSELEALPAGQSTPLAVAYVGLGDTARALDHLEAAAASRDPYLLQMSLTPTWFEPIRSHPRFAAVARALGLDPGVMSRPAHR